jgi:hypothetical protein
MHVRHRNLANMFGRGLNMRNKFWSFGILCCEGCVRNSKFLHWCREYNQGMRAYVVWGHTSLSRARYTLPNLPRPKGLPISKSVKDHRFSFLPLFSEPPLLWASCSNNTDQNQIPIHIRQQY